MFLLDTNVISETRRPAGHQGVLDWIGSVSSVDKYVSVLTVGELRRGIELVRRRDSRQAQAHEHWFERVVAAFGPRVLNVDTAVAQRWGHLGLPDPLSAVDGLIAATALVHGLTVVTRNVRDFERCGVPTVNPFS